MLGDELQLDLTLRRGAVVRGIVFGLDDAPVAERVVELAAPELGVFHRTRTGAEGRFEFAGLEPGAWRALDARGVSSVPVSMFRLGRDAGGPPALDQLSTEALVDRFADRSRLSLEPDEAEADAVVRAVIERYSVTPVAVTGENVAALNRVTVAVRVVVALMVLPNQVESVVAPVRRTDDRMHMVR